MPNTVSAIVLNDESIFQEITYIPRQHGYSSSGIHSINSKNLQYAIIDLPSAKGVWLWHELTSGANVSPGFRVTER